MLLFIEYIYVCYGNIALLALASQRAEFLALEMIDTDWTRSILEEMTRKERGSIPGPIEFGIIMYIISECSTHFSENCYFTTINVSFFFFYNNLCFFLS